MSRSERCYCERGSVFYGKHSQHITPPKHLTQCNPLWALTRPPLSVRKHERDCQVDKTNGPSFHEPKQTACVFVCGGGEVGVTRDFSAWKGTLRGGSARDERTPPGIPRQPVNALLCWRYWEWRADGATPLEDGSRKGRPYRV